MIAAGTVAALAADVPLGRLLRLDVVVHRVAAVAERPGGTAVVVGRIERHPPVGVRLHEVRAPDAMRHVPLRRQRKVIVAHLLEVALLPLRAVDERNVVLGERQQRIGLREVRDDDFGMDLRIRDHVRHPRLRPARIDRRVTVAAAGRADIGGLDCRGWRRRGARWRGLRLHAHGQRPHQQRAGENGTSSEAHTAP